MRYTEQMSFLEFLQTLDQDQVPAEIGLSLQALWHDRKGDWQTAHEVAQSEDSKEAAWVHAYLHRKEGDVGNADYWYARASRSRPDVSLE